MVLQLTRSTSLLPNSLLKIQVSKVHCSICDSFLTPSLAALIVCTPQTHSSFSCCCNLSRRARDYQRASIRILGLSSILKASEINHKTSYFSPKTQGCHQERPVHPGVHFCLYFPCWHSSQLVLPYSLKDMHWLHRQTLCCQLAWRLHPTHLSALTDYPGAQYPEQIFLQLGKSVLCLSLRLALKSS